LPDVTDIKKDIHFSAPIGKVWAALTDPKVIRAWMGDDDKIKVDLKVGGRYAFFEGETTGEFTEIDPPSVLEYTWRQKSWKKDWPDSVVRWELREAGKGTQVHLLHKSFPNQDERDSHNEGWDMYFLEPMAEVLDG